MLQVRFPRKHTPKTEVCIPRKLFGECSQDHYPEGAWWKQVGEQREVELHCKRNRGLSQSCTELWSCLKGLTLQSSPRLGQRGWIVTHPPSIHRSMNVSYGGKGEWHWRSAFLQLRADLGEGSAEICGCQYCRQLGEQACSCWGGCGQCSRSTAAPAVVLVVVLVVPVSSIYSCCLCLTVSKLRCNLHKTVKHRF